MGLKISTLHSQLHNMIVICKLCKKTLRDAKKEDVIQIVRLIEEQNWKESYKKILKNHAEEVFQVGQGNEGLS